MISGTVAGGVFGGRKMLRNAETCQQVRKSWEVSLLDRKFSLLRPGPPPGCRWWGGGKSNRWEYLFLIHGQFLTFCPDVLGPRPPSLNVSRSCRFSRGRPCCRSLWMVCSFVVRSSGLLPIRALPFLPVRSSVARRSLSSRPLRPHGKVRRALCKCALRRSAPSFCCHSPDGRNMVLPPAPACRSTRRTS